jgi:hypothetical protein
VTLPIGLLARQASDLSRPSPIGRGTTRSVEPHTEPRRGAGESNAILLIWNQLGHHGLRPEERFVRESNSSHSLDRGTATPVASRSIRAPGSSRTSAPPLRKQRAGSAGESVEGTSGVEPELAEPQSAVQSRYTRNPFVGETGIEPAFSCTQGTRLTSRLLPEKL